MTNNKTTNTDSMDAVNFVLFFFRWWKPLLIVLITAATSSMIISGFIKPKFKSTVVFFPSTTNSISKALLSDNPGDKQDILEFGQEVEAEQMLQFLNSDNIRDRIISKYDLMKHYEIEPDSKYPLTRLNKEYESNISFERTEFMSVKIIVYDTDPQLAADIANDISDYLDSMKTNVQRQRALEGFKIVEREYIQAQELIRILDDSLKKIRSHGIYDYPVQSKILNEEFTRVSSILSNETARLNVLEKLYSEKDTTVINARARISGANSTMKELDVKLKNLAEYGGANVSLTDLLELQRKQLSILREKFEKAKVDAEQSLPHKFIVNHAVKAEKKTYPIRWLIVVLSTLSSLLLCVLILAGIEHYRKYLSLKSS